MREIIHHWWILGLRSLLAFALAAGIFLLQAWAKFSILDAVTIPFLIVGLSLYGMLDSLLLIYLGLQFAPSSPARSVTVTQGLVGAGIAAMLLTIFFRSVEVRWFLYLITAQAAMTGIFEVMTGFRFTRHIREEWACFAAGAASLGFAVLVQTGGPMTMQNALDWFLGYALLLAVSSGWFSYRLRRLNQELPHPSEKHVTAG
jgi:hypothetical protein